MAGRDQLTHSTLIPEELLTELLRPVRLGSFTATPETVSPFEASLLRWSVEGPPDVVVTLNGSPVAKDASLVVHPRTTQGFELGVQASGARMVLGQVIVQVDTSTCTTDTLGSVVSRFKRELGELVERQPQLGFQGLYRQVAIPSIPNATSVSLPVARHLPEVTIEDGSFRFRLFLVHDVKVASYPDFIVDVDIDAVFSLHVDETGVVIVFRRLSVDVTVPPWLWLLPNALIELPAVVSSHEDRLREQLRTSLPPMLRDAVASSVPPDRRIVALQVSPDGDGLIHITHCPRSPGSAIEP